MSKRFAEKANYWATTVHPAKSQAEIMVMLEDFGATQYQVMQGQAGGRHAWMIRFEWERQSYRFAFTPLLCQEPTKSSTFGGARRQHADQSRYQMGRIAVHFVKAILTAAEAHPAALFGFMELPDQSGGLPHIMSELGVDTIRSALSDPQFLLMGADETVNGEFTVE